MSFEGGHDMTTQSTLRVTPPAQELAQAQFKAILAWFGDNRAPVLLSEVSALEDRLNNLGAITGDTAPILRDIMAEARNKANELEIDRKTDQKPSELDIEKIRSAYRPLVDRASMVVEVARKDLNGFLEAERVRLAAEAQAAADEVERKRRELLNAQEGGAFDVDPDLVETRAKEVAEAEVEATYAERINSSGPTVSSATGMSRAAGQRVTFSAKATDYKKLVNAMWKDPKVQEAALKAAAAMMRASRGTAVISGAEAVEVRNAA
jgi:hypothetical protein